MGSRQFLGKQLEQQANKLGELIDAMALMVANQDVSYDGTVQQLQAVMTGIITAQEQSTVDQVAKFNEMITKLTSMITTQTATNTNLTNNFTSMLGKQDTTNTNLVTNLGDLITKMASMLGKQDGTIAKMQEMVNKQAESVPQYANVSNVSKNSKNYGGLNLYGAGPITMTMYVSGTVRIKMNCNAPYAGPSVEYIRNGVRESYWTLTQGVNDNTIDVSVMEGDYITIKGGSSFPNITINTITVLYDLIAKPGVSL